MATTVDTARPDPAQEFKGLRFDAVAVAHEHAGSWAKGRIAAGARRLIDVSQTADDFWRPEATTGE